jgi:beta-glucanase (GH16 family)
MILMKKIVVVVAIVLSLYSFQAQERKLVWADEFDENELNQEHWSLIVGDGCPQLCGWGNDELQVYTDQNHRIENGMLYIKAEREREHYTSTRINTKGKKAFQYGRFEVRAKLAVGKGVWPAFWLLGTNIDQVGWPLCGEIDVLEYVGRSPQEIFTSLHTLAGHGDYASTKTTRIENIEEGFHVYAADWNKDQIAFYVDGENVFTFAPKDKNQEIWPFNQPFYLLVNLAVGGNFGGKEVVHTVFPQEFVIDYIRVYQ